MGRRDNNGGAEKTGARWSDERGTMAGMGEAEVASGMGGGGGRDEAAVMLATTATITTGYTGAEAARYWRR